MTSRHLEILNSANTPSLAKFLFLYIFIHIRFLFSDPDVTVSHYFYQFLLWELRTCPLHRTTVYYYIIRIANCKYILYVQSQSWSLLEFIKITTFELPLTNQTTAKITHTERNGRVFIAAYSARNDKTKLPSSQGHRTRSFSHLLGGRKIGLLRLTYHTHTRIFLEEIGLLFVTSKAPFT